MAGGLYNTCTIVWPTVPWILCIWHVNKNVLKHCRDLWWDEAIQTLNAESAEKHVKSIKEIFQSRWSAVLYAKSEEDFETAWNQFQSHYSTNYPQIVAYSMKHYFNDEVKRAIVPAWTDKIRHFGNQATNRAEGINKAVKKRLQSWRGHLNEVFDHIDRYLDLHNRKICHSLEDQRLRKRTDF